MSLTQKQRAYEVALRDHVSAVTFKCWPFHYYCGLLDKHQPDEKGCTYSIRLNKTRGFSCGKVTLIHELTHILEELEHLQRSNAKTESEALRFCKRNRKFVNYLWEKYIAL
ncbi:MAG: hypothetical protein AABY00_03400 [Nanoarchaeota archaeon]